MTTRILVNGALGKMGQEVVKMVQNEPNFTLVGSTDQNDNLSETIKKTNAQIVVDFTHPSVGFQNSKTIIEAGAHPIIGTTGFSTEQIAELKKLCATKKLGGIVAPNFSIGAVLMMKYARDAAHYFSAVEIIESHHDGKADAPSGTAIKTAEMIAEVKNKTKPKVGEKITIEGSRGGVHHDIHIHAVRLPGIVADQQVIFGSVGETLTLAHRTVHREAFMPGVRLACQKVLELNELVYGLEHLL
jgi:4-hydroxy-tetrahydrodipicolinate reductase